jgi:Lipid A 3-O-deacylase (PagL)
MRCLNICNRQAIWSRTGRGQCCPPMHLERKTRAKARIWISRIALALCAGCAPAFVAAQSWCASCEVQIGLGGTYHFWGATGGVVLPVTVDWRDGRYELGLFRVTTQQILYDSNSPHGRLMADPYWGLSISRRWRLFERGPIRGFFGFGLSAKTESDQLSVTRLDFASQLGLRFSLPGGRVVGELTMRHWSNAGIRLPNHGQDFATLTFRLNTGRFGVEREDAIGAEDLEKSVAARSAAIDDSEGLP